MHVSCDDVRATLIEAVAAGRTPADAAALAHIESCPACRAARADYERLWKEMGSLTTPEPAPDARARFRRRLAAAGLASSRPVSSRALAAMVGVAAAVALVAGLGGYRLGAHQAGEGTDVAQSAAASPQPAFLLLLHEDSSFRRGEPYKSTVALAHEYSHWADGLPGGAYITSAPLIRHTGIWLGAPHQSVAPGDFVDGYFLIHAKDMAAAQQIAETCPHLKYGGRIEVHQIDRAILNSL